MIPHGPQHQVNLRDPETQLRCYQVAQASIQLTLGVHLGRVLQVGLHFLDLLGDIYHEVFMKEQLIYHLCFYSLNHLGEGILCVD